MKQGNHRKAKTDSREYAAVKQGMVDAAIELMAGNGFRKFRFEALAEKLGCNRATIYRYFDSKQDLISAVMMNLMQDITRDIIRQTAGNTVSSQSFTDALYEIITRLRENPRYAIVMDAQNVETFARLTHAYFSDITTSMLEKFLIEDPARPVLKEGLAISDVVGWLMHQIISYGFFGIPGESEQQRKDYLLRMVVSVVV